MVDHRTLSRNAATQEVVLTLVLLLHSWGPGLALALSRRFDFMECNLILNWPPWRSGGATTLRSRRNTEWDELPPKAQDSYLEDAKTASEAVEQQGWRLIPPRVWTGSEPANSTSQRVYIDWSGTLGEAECGS
jgi:hypothetical protein